MKEVLFIDYDKLKELDVDEVGLLMKILLECDVLGVIGSGRVEKLVKVSGLGKYQVRRILDNLEKKGVVSFIGHSGVMINPNILGTTTKKQFMKERGELWATLLKEGER